jgi:RNA polymerase sigma-70 factor (ECF subfamily)
MTLAAVLGDGDGAHAAFRPESAPALDDADDPTLVGALIAGDPRAPGVLWRRFAPMVFRILRRSLGSRTEVEDLAQDVFISIYRKVPGIRNPRALKAFIITTTVLTARGELRRISSRRQMAALARGTPPTDSETLTARADAREGLLRFYRLVDRLKPFDRAAFVLRFIEGLALGEVAAALGVSLPTIKRRLARSWARMVLLVERDPVLSHYSPHR